MRPNSPSRTWKDSFAASAAQRLLFRSLTDPRLLRTNPLLTRFLPRRAESARDDEQAVEAARTAVRALAERFREVDRRRGQREQGERRYLAVVRCDLGCEPVASVAADLGVSLRQFRRERKAARERIARALLADHQHQAATAAPDAIVLDLAIASRLWDTGMFEAALDILRGVPRESHALPHRINALTTIAELLVDRDMPSEAASALQSARTILAEGVDVDGGTLAFCTCLLELAQSSMEVQRNDPAGEARLDWVLGKLPMLGDALAGPGAELMAAALVKKVSLLLTQGALREARAEMARLTALLAGASVRLPSLAIDCLALQGDIAAMQSDFDLARSILQRALELSMEHGFRRRSVRTRMVLAELHYQYGNRERGIADARGCVANAQRIGIPNLTASAAVTVSTLELLEGHARDARTYLDLAKQHVLPGSLLWARFANNLSALRLLTGDPEAALAGAIEADQAAAALGSRRLRGSALRTIAEAQFALGHPARANAAIAMALDILDGSGSRGSLALAYNASAVISGRSQDRMQALELFPNLPKSQLKRARAS
jgi:tetratricopeptide (TPR) repeat protein